MNASYSPQRILSVARKESLHLLRDPTTLFFALLIPVLQLLILGYAIDTNVRDIKTIVVDHCNSKDSERLLRRFENTKDFKIIGQVYSETALSEAIMAGKARVGILIPHDYSRRLEGRQMAQIRVVVDGSDSSVAAEAMNVGQALALRETLDLVRGHQPFGVDARLQILFNPNTRSPNFLLPGLMVILCQMLAIILSATAIVREKEHGTLEQLFMTPIKVSELILGKLAPYLVLTFVEFATILLLMNLVFRVPIHGNVATLLVQSLPFILCMLAMGLFISTRVATRDAAMQLTLGTMLPSIFLSGYIFPIESMPLIFQYLSQLIPATWLIDSARGIILRGAGWRELWLNCLVLWGLGLVIVIWSMLRFHKRLS